jgi:hypothetical protein
VVPRIQFEELGSMSSGGGLAHSYSNMSLSGALLSDGHTVRMSTNNGEANVCRVSTVLWSWSRFLLCIIGVGYAMSS